MTGSIWIATRKGVEISREDNIFQQCRMAQRTNVKFWAMILYLSSYECRRKEEGEKTVIPAVGSALLVRYETVTPYDSSDVTHNINSSSKGTCTVANWTASNGIHAATIKGLFSYRPIVLSASFYLMGKVEDLIVQPKLAPPALGLMVNLSVPSHLARLAT